MERKTTKELEQILENTSIEQVKNYLINNADSLLTSDRPFADFMRAQIKEKNLKQNRIFLDAEIPERYGYKLISEQQHTQQRDTLLRLCYASRFNFCETQEALQIYRMPPLYARIPRDALLIIIFRKHPKNGIIDINDINNLLMQNGLEPLRQVGRECELM